MCQFNPNGIQVRIKLVVQEMIMLHRMLLALLFCLSACLGLAADPPPSSAGPKSKEFAAIDKEWKELIANLGAMKTEYATADAARKAEILKLYNAGLEKGKELEGKLVEAAKAAYVEAPNADQNIVQILASTLYEEVNRDDYEPAFVLGKLLMDNKCPVKDVVAPAGVAAFCVNEYELADTWLKAAEQSGALANLCKSMPKKNRYPGYPAMVELSKTGWASEKKIREAEAKANDLPRVLLKTSAGDIEVELFENEAPNTVLSFITLVDKGFYNGVKFHRVLPGFMAQGGDPKGDGTGGPGYTIPDECHRPDHRLHFRGSLSMAHSSKPDSGGSQFFMCFEPAKSLDGEYTVFGRIISGMDVLGKIKRRDPDEQTVGAADTIIEAKVTRRRPHPYDAKDVKKSGNTD
jgi:cyclophilin family peptidyl-prolyl cis-trans isomerase